MSTRPPTGAEMWGGRPVARTVAAAQPRGRVVLAGRLDTVVCRDRHDPRVEAMMDDGTGQITLRWLGRHAVPGVTPGALMTVEGTVVDERGHWVLLNPIYQFHHPSGSVDGGPEGRDGLPAVAPGDAVDPAYEPSGSRGAAR